MAPQYRQNNYRTGWWIGAKVVLREKRVQLVVLQLTAMLSAVLAMAIILSVRPSVTCLLCVKRNERRMMSSLQLGSTM